MIRNNKSEATILTAGDARKGRPIGQTLPPRRGGGALPIPRSDHIQLLPILATVRLETRSFVISRHHATASAGNYCDFLVSPSGS